MSAQIVAISPTTGFYVVKGKDAAISLLVKGMKSENPSRKRESIENTLLLKGEDNNDYAYPGVVHCKSW